MEVFPSPPKERSRPLGRTEPGVVWLRDFTTPQAKAARELVNEWYRLLPDPEQKFAIRLTSEDNSAHYGALDELFLYQRLLETWSDVRYEEGGMGPDFRLYDSGVCRVAIEVLSLFASEEADTEDRRHGRIVDGINARVKATAGYFLNVDIVEARHDPNLRQLAAFINRAQLKLPNPDELRAAHPEGLGLRFWPMEVYRESGVVIILRFFPAARDSRLRTDPDARIVGMGPSTGGLVTTGERLRERVDAKAGSRYAIGDIPFGIATFIHELFTDQDEILSGVYGRNTISLPSGTQGRRRGGAFGFDSKRQKGRLERVSAILAVNEFHIWTPEEAQILTLTNPYARKPWPLSALSTGRTFGVVGEDDNHIQLGWLTTIDES